jgi:toxin-antitoxin system PIN domain toxin
VIAVDTNVLVYAHREDATLHEAALEVLQRLAGGTAPWAIPWPCVHEFFSVVTHARIYVPPTPRDTALAAIESWLEAPTLRLLSEGAGHAALLAQVVKAGKISGPAVHDARIAALCMANGVTELYSADRDFSRFPRLKTVNPLVR